MIYHKLKRARLRGVASISGFFSRGMVLLYHRVGELQQDPQQLSVTPENFDQQMAVLTKAFFPVSLREMVARVREGNIRDRSVAVTFDDGYEDNFNHAYPVLKKYGIPATIFVSSGYTGTRREFWWDELERLVLGDHSLPDSLRFTVNGTTVHYRVRKIAPLQGSLIQMDDPTPTGASINLTPPAIYRDLCARCQVWRSDQIDQVILQLREVFDDSGTGRPGYLPMSAEQLRKLSSGGLVEIGGHTRTHVNLAAQHPHRQLQEIAGCKEDLEDMIDAVVDSFSYPFGTLSHYTTMTKKLVRQTGFKNAIANFSFNVSRFSHPYEIPRRIVRNWNGLEFEKVLNRYHSANRIGAAAT